MENLQEAMTIFLICSGAGFFLMGVASVVRALFGRKE